MWDDDLASDKHEVVHANPSPFATAVVLLAAAAAAAANSELGAHFATPVQEEPDRVPFLYFT